jgi:hypothetical protein
METRETPVITFGEYLDFGLLTPPSSQKTATISGVTVTIRHFEYTAKDVNWVGTISDEARMVVNGKPAVLRVYGNKDNFETRQIIFNKILASFEYSPVTPTPTPPQIPTGWTKRPFPDANLFLYAPSAWKSDIQYFSDVPSYLIRLWQGSTPSTATVQLEIKNNWDNTGNAQSLDRSFQIGDQLYAAKVDPPKMAEQKLDRYQTNYYFERNSKVYVLTCVHNWITANYQMCETLLKTMQFSD